MSRLSLVLAAAIAILFAGCKTHDNNDLPQASRITGKKYGKQSSPQGTQALVEGGDGDFSPKRYSMENAPPNLVFIEGGTMHMGGPEKDIGYEQSNRERQITVHSFYIDRTEIANGEWKEFCWSTARDSGRQVAELMLPDTTVWFRDLGYNEPFVELYFQNPAFNNYPVVGVSWHQSQEFCKWRTSVINKGLLEEDPEAVINPRFRLPTEGEWEYAARGLLEQELYPWEGKSLRNQKGRFNGNFKRGRGDYAGRSNEGGSNLIEGLNDGYMIPGPVDSDLYGVNDFGLFNMAGNVAEWTMDTYRVLAFEDVQDFQPYRRKGEIADQEEWDYVYGKKSEEAGRMSLIHNMYDPSRVGRFNPAAPDKGDDWDRVKVYRGGSWSDVAYYLSCGTRRFWNSDSSASNIGFRCAMSRVGSPTLKY